MEDREAYLALRNKLGDQWWRLNNLYFITNPEGARIPFRPNRAQAQLYRSMWYFNVILKARQLGFSTFILVYLLDCCLFNSDVRAGVIAQTRDDAEALFTEKIRFPYDQLPSWLREQRPCITDRAGELKFPNNSSIRVGTSLRGGTLQYLHVSEYGKISAKFPEKAREIKTGAFNAVHAGQFIFVESTAEGQEGEFFDLCQRAQTIEQEGRPLSPLDPKFHFFPWWAEPSYVLPAGGVVVPADLTGYFADLETKIGQPLSPEQRAWYASKHALMGDDMKREFPGTPEEAFEASIEGAYFGPQMAKVRREGRICRVPIETGVPVNTYWDLGVNDQMTIWFHQQVGKEQRFVDYYENSGEGFAHYAKVLQERREKHGFAYGQHYGPHDLTVREMGVTAKPRWEIAKGLGIHFEIVPRVESKNDAIEAARGALGSCWFDAERCATGIGHLDRYRKEWDDHRGVWKNQPRHDAASHGADGFMTFATARKPTSGFNRKINYGSLGIA